MEKLSKFKTWQRPVVAFFKRTATEPHVFEIDSDNINDAKRKKTTMEKKEFRIPVWACGMKKRGKTRTK